MKRDKLFEDIQDIFRDIFDDQLLKITETTSAKDIDEWDSLNHVTLIVAIEKEFKIKFSFEELASLKDVESIVDLVFAKRKH